MTAAAGRPRLAGLAAMVAGIGVSPWLPEAPGLEALGLAAVVAALAVRSAGGRRLAAVVVCAALVGMTVGLQRVHAIDASAARIAEGERVQVRGFVEAVPRRTHGEVRVRVATREGSVLLVAPEPVPDLDAGREIEATGTARAPAPWELPGLVRVGVGSVVESGSIHATGARRGGLPYLTDRLRDRAEDALSRGTPRATAALLRGFVLGQDDRIDGETVEHYQRSGLAHLLAVSGQNVMLLALLAMPLLALLGLGIRARLACVLVLIALYVPVAGAGPSIQRAGVMGAAGIVAVLASRPASRWYVVLLAAAVTLALNPRASGDVGWQLSFAAVVGIALWAAPLSAFLRREAARASVGGALAEGAAITIAATLATAPLMAHHFDRLSLASLGANLLALPAVAPVMWLGMLAAAVGQLPALPVEPLTALAGVFAAYITQVAEWTAAPGWAQVEVELGSAGAVVCVYGLLGAGAWAAGRIAAARAALRPRSPPRIAIALLGGAIVIALASAAASGPPKRPAPLTVRALDVGQGDAILLQPRRADPVLVDTGPPAAGVSARLRELGVERLEAVLVTHDQSDHAGGLASVLAAVDTDVVAFGAPRPALKGVARVAGVPHERVAVGSVVRSGPLELEVLWPGDTAETAASQPDPNRLSVVSVARFREFEMLLTGDAEAEAAPLDPGPVDVLKVAHHGSADGGLGALLDRTTPELAVVSVGEANPFGHPHLDTSRALAERGVPLLRTDVHGEVVIEVGAGGFTARGSA